MPLTPEERRIKEITALHDEITVAARTTVEKALRIGELLCEQKASLKHGQWEQWMKANLKFSRATANNYMRLYRHRDKLKTLTFSDLKTAFGEIASVLAEPDPKPDEHEVRLVLNSNEKDEWDDLMGTLIEKVFRGGDTKQTVLNSLRFTLAHKELVNEEREDNPSHVGTARRVGAGANGQVSGRSALQPAG